MMRRIRGAISDFLFGGDSDRWVSCLRIGIAFVSLLYCLSLRADWADLFLQDRRGPLNRDLGEAILSLNSPWIPRLGWLIDLGSHLGLGEATIVWAAWWVLLAASLFLLSGLFSRESSWLSAFLHLATVKSVASLTYGLDNFTSIGLFYLVIGPLPDRLSLDYLWRKRQLPPPERSGFFRRALQLHLCIAYLFGGIAKCAGQGWWDGSSLWRALIRPPFNQLSPGLILSVSAILPLLGIAACLLETGYAFFIWPRCTRRFWLWTVVLMHAGIGVAFGLYLFAVVMIVLNLAAFARWAGDREMLSTVAPASGTIG